MYQPGRHSSYHQDSRFRINELMIFHYGYAPWNDLSLARKMQIKDRVSSGDLRRKWGLQHFSEYKELDVDFIGGQGPLTKDEELAISEFIKSQKLLRSKKQPTKTKSKVRTKVVS